MEKGLLRKQFGMSLVELMIALTIGLILSAALITIYISNKKVFWDSEAAAILQENNRFVLKLITNDLRMAGFYGGVDYKLLKKNVADLTAGACKRDEVFDESSSEISGGTTTEYEYGISVWAVEAGQQIPSCLIGLDVDSSTDILFVKHARKKPVADGTSTAASKTYIISGFDSGEHVGGTGDTTLSSKLSANAEYAGGDIWEYIYHIYYVYKPSGSVYSQLKRIKLAKDGWGAPETVAEGVEDLHYIFGVHDSSVAGTGMVTRYYSASEVPNWSDVVSATVYLRGRSTMSDISYHDDKTYSYGKRVNVAPTGTDVRYHRKLLETTVSFFNNQMEQARR